jgi:hypothetical protein
MGRFSLKNPKSDCIAKLFCRNVAQKIWQLKYARANILTFRNSDDMFLVLEFSSIEFKEVKTKGSALHRL